MSKIVILVGSMRKNGNTARLAQSFAEGASKNNNVEIVSVADYNVNPCIGCNSCFTREGNQCFQGDDMVQIYDKLRNADIVVIASPVYFYGISAQLPNLFDPILMQYQMVLDFFKLESIGTVLVRGVKDIGDIENNSALKEANELGALM